MTQREVELILVRQLASYLTIPIFVVDPEGTLIFFNEPAEVFLARRFDETEELSLDEWTELVNPANLDGSPLRHDQRPITTSLEEHRPAHAKIWITNQLGESREIEVTTFPIVGQAGRDLGAVALFWGVEK
ncbi:MAG: PAS domain-containing protein [Actinomycetota bacterium]|nr:PAS domain-containing protein [Actinomycetota bacterium]